MNSKNGPLVIGGVVVALLLIGVLLYFRSANSGTTQLPPQGTFKPGYTAPTQAAPGGAK